MSGFVDRVAVQAVSVRPLRLLLAVVAAVFYVVGFVVGLVVVAVKFAVAAVKVGVSECHARFAPKGDG